MLEIEPTTCWKGLSPLARGNHYSGVVHCVIRGPIPARAGEPRAQRDRRRRSGAYPRSRGGTCTGHVARARVAGLSPLARGNHLGQRRGVALVGPIPARAGEPLASNSLMRKRKTINAFEILKNVNRLTSAC